MLKIKRITIRRSSGYGVYPIDSWKSKLRICKDYISYNYIPDWHEEKPIRWLYKANSLASQKLFQELTEIVEKIICLDDIPWCTDVGGTIFVIALDNGTIISRTFWIGIKEGIFKECDDIIEKMIAECERTQS
ncbi:MAG: hypothetical protein K6G50_07425 [bacterium]|nr:hypothetical protein [bacterium]